jgi:hypothetical protein
VQDQWTAIRRRDILSNPSERDYAAKRIAAGAPPRHDSMMPDGRALVSGMPDYDDNNARPLSGDERMRVRFAAQDLAARLARLHGRVPPDTWRNVAARQIGDAMIAERNRQPPKR